MSNPFGKPAAENEDDWSVDLSDVQTGYFIPEGDYQAKCIDLAKTVAKSSGNPMYVFTFCIMDGEFVGRDFKMYCALTPMAMFKIAEVAQALELEADEDTGKFNFNPKNVIGRGVTLHIVDDEYQGKINSKIKNISPHPKGSAVYAKKIK